jgi:hypothetical protein
VLVRTTDLRTERPDLPRMVKRGIADEPTAHLNEPLQVQ